MDALSVRGASVEVYVRGKVRLERKADLAGPFDYEYSYIHTMPFGYRWKAIEPVV